MGIRDPRGGPAEYFAEPTSVEQIFALVKREIQRSGYEDLLASGAPLAARVLKVAHHGSGGSSCQDFLEAVAPTYAVISVGEDNRFGHPDEGVLERLAELKGVK